MKATSRTTDNGVEIIKLEGKITIGAGDQQLREAIGTAMSAGQPNILLDMSGVTTIDSSGIGGLVGSSTTVTNPRGTINPPPLTTPTTASLPATSSLPTL